MPATSKMSLIPTGTPWSGPRTYPARVSASRSRATARAPSGSACVQAKTSPSSPRMRSRHASSSAVAVILPSRIRRWASRALRRISRRASSEDIQHLRHDLEAAEGRHEVRAGVARADLADELLGHLDAGAKRAVARGTKPGPHAIGNRDPGDLVVEELGVAEAVERQHPDEHGHR